MIITLFEASDTRRRTGKSKRDTRRRPVNTLRRKYINSDFYSGRAIVASHFLYFLIPRDSPNTRFHRAAYGLELFTGRVGTSRTHFDDERSVRFEHRFPALERARGL